MNESTFGNPYRQAAERIESDEPVFDWHAMTEGERIKGERTIFDGQRLSNGLYWTSWKGEARPRKLGFYICSKDGARLKTLQFIELPEVPNENFIVQELRGGKLAVFCNGRRMIYGYEHDGYVLKEDILGEWFKDFKRMVYEDEDSSIWLKRNPEDEKMRPIRYRKSKDDIFGRPVGPIGLGNSLPPEIHERDTFNFLQDGLDRKHMIVLFDRGYGGPSLHILDIDIYGGPSLIEKHGLEDGVHEMSQLKSGDLLVGRDIWQRKEGGKFEEGQRLDYGGQKPERVKETYDGHLIGLVEDKVLIWEKQDGVYKVCEVIDNGDVEPETHLGYSTPNDVKEINPGTIVARNRKNLVRVWRAGEGKETNPE